MKKTLALFLTLALMVSGISLAMAEGYTPGTYEASANGFGGDVSVKVTVDETSIVSVEVEGAGETSVGADAVAGAADAIAEKGSANIEDYADVDVISASSITSPAIFEALNAALAQAAGEAPAEEAALAFTAGTYTGTADGYNAPVEVSVTFSEDAVTAIDVTKHAETSHVGDVAFAPMIADMIAANGTGVDAVAGATFSSRALREAVNAAAEAAGCTNLAAFKANTVAHEAQAPVEDTWDIVVVGAGGAGLAAAAQAAQDGNTVLIIEKAAEMGGNTLVAGGAFQSVMPYLVWDPADPDATTGVNPIDGKTYDKVKSDAGRVEILKTILSWSEEPFDGTVDEEHPFVAGEIGLNAVRGVHEEYLPVLKALKEEIQAYLDWAQPQLDAGVKETQLTLFSTLNLHIFQTYYGGLRPSADNSEWIYGDVDLVTQYVLGGQDIKPWLVAQGSKFDFAGQTTLIGCLWQRENGPLGGVVDGVEYSGADNKWGTYFAVPYNTMITADEHNQLMTRTTATELIVEDGKVTGVKAASYDGTEVTAHAAKGVILATGGYGANIQMVQETNKYWDPAYIADNIGTTNRCGMTGDGIVMAEAVGAATEGMGWTQMMPLGWVDNGNLSRGAGENVIFINAATGKRYVDESAERDVLSLGGFQNGMSKEAAEAMGLKYVPGIYVELSNPAVAAKIGITGDIEGRAYLRTVEEAAEMIGCDADVLRETVEQYDQYAMGLTDEIDVPKLAIQGTIGDVETDEDGNYLPDTYKIDKLCVRFMAPSTHHTMGGLKVDTDRHVLNTEGEIIPGLFAAGEVTGGNHAGNRLGGNAITEIIVSGRAAAQAINAENP